MRVLVMLWVLGTGGVAALDIVTLKDGRLVKGELSYVADEKLKIRMMIAGPRGTGSSLRDVPMDKVDWIDFAMTPLERKVLADAGGVTKSELHLLWGERSVRLENPRSNAGEFGLIYARRLLGGGVRAEVIDAIRVFGIIEKGDWDVVRRGAARVGRLRALMALGRADEAVVEAVAMAEETEDPGLLIEARYVLALAEFDQLKALELAHPRWIEDDEVRPEREALFHRAVDRHLFAYLHYGSEEAVAARGLWGAREVFEFAGEGERARECARDVVELYPETEFADKARDYLKKKADENETK